MKNTLNTDLKEKMMAFAKSQGEDFLHKAVKDNNGWYWKVYEVYNGKIKEEKLSDSIYSGMAGTLLFLIQLYETTKEDKYLEACIEGGNWLISQDNKTYNLSFYVGNTGVAYTLIKLYRITNKKVYYDKAIDIVKTSVQNITPYAYVNNTDLLLGHAGSLLGLAHLYSNTKEEWILEQIDVYIKFLIRYAKFGLKGISWDGNSFDHVRNLCGFSHGVSGIGWVFLELAHYFKNEALTIIAEQAFQYENLYFDKENFNWYDFRSSAGKELYDKAIDAMELMALKDAKNKSDYRSGKVEDLLAAKHMIAWCHGAPGIGLSRLRAADTFKKEIYEKDIKTATSKTIETFMHMGDLSICHGMAGNFILLNEAAKLINKEGKSTELSNAILDKIANIDSIDEPYRGLFLDQNVGRAYLYSYLLQDNPEPSILMPSITSKIDDEDKLNKENYSYVFADRKMIFHALLSSGFERTLDILKNTNEAGLDELICGLNAEEDIYDKFTHFVEETIKQNDNYGSLIEEIFEIERDTIALYREMPSITLWHTKNQVIHEDINAMLLLSEAEFFNQKVEINADIVFKQTSWKWNQEDFTENINKQAEEFWQIIFLNNLIKPEEIYLSKLEAVILNEFEEEAQIKAVIDNIVAQFNIQDNEQELQVRNKVCSIIKDFMRVNFLIPHQYQFD